MARYGALGGVPRYYGDNYYADFPEDPYAPQLQQQSAQGAFGGTPGINPMMAMRLFGSSGSSAGSGTASTGAGAGSGTTGALGSLGPIGAIAAAVAVSKGMEARNPDGVAGKLGRAFNAPSAAQVKEDPRTGLTALLGLPFLNYFLMNDKAKSAKPEWESLLGL